MLQLSPNETVLLAIRKHWYVFAGPMSRFILLLLAPPLALVLTPLFYPNLIRSEFRPIINFFLSVYVMGLESYAFMRWLDYYLDVWIITDQRIIDIEQRGLFNRQTSEIAIERVQNVTVEVAGLIPTMLKFGNIKIQTAGEGEFTISQVPNLDQARELIVKHSQSKRSAPQTLTP